MRATRCGLTTGRLRGPVAHDERTADDREPVRALAGARVMGIREASFAGGNQRRRSRESVRRGHIYLQGAADPT